MNNIENTSINYDELIEAVGGENIIKCRIEQISREMLDFLAVKKDTLYYYLKFRR